MDKEEFVKIAESEAAKYVEYCFPEELKDTPKEAMDYVFGDFLEGMYTAYEILTGTKI